MNGNCVNSWRRNKMRVILIRIVFYGLFFVGPSFLSESHATHVRMNVAMSEAPDCRRAEIQEAYQTREHTLKWLGIGCCGIWFVWLVLALCYHVFDMTMAFVRKGNSNQKKC